MEETSRITEAKLKAYHLGIPVKVFLDRMVFLGCQIDEEREVEGMRTIVRMFKENDEIFSNASQV